MNRTLLYFPWTHGYKEAENFVDVNTNIEIREEYFRLKKYFNTEFWNEFSSIKCLYLYVEGCPALEVPSVVTYLRETNTEPIGRTVDEYATQALSDPRTTIMVKLAYSLPLSLKIPCKFVGIEDPSLSVSKDGIQIREVEVPMRDKFYAFRIDETLPKDGVGALFVGHGHNVHHSLPKSILVKFPVGLPSPVPWEPILRSALKIKRGNR